MNDTQNQIERSLLGIAFQSPRDLRDLHGTRTEWFTNPLHAETWKIITSLTDQGKGVDPLIVEGHQHLADPLVRKKIDRKYLADLQINAPYGHLGAEYKNRLREAHDRNTTHAALTRGLQLLDGGATTRDVRLEAMAGLQAVTDMEATLTGISESVEETIKSFDEITPYVPTPWDQLNKAIRGWRPGGLYTIGARPGVGKSLLLQNAALHLASRGPVILETMEMNHREVTTRLISMMTGIPQDKLVGRRPDGSTALSPHDWDQIRDAQQKLAGLPLRYGERTQTPADVREHARAARVHGPLQGIFVDYLQLMASPGRVENRVQELTKFTRELKQIAMEFDCPVILASQLNRNAANEHRPPQKSELRDSGSIEQDSDVVVLMHADPSVVSPVVNGRDLGVALDLIVDKNRQGPEMVGYARRFGTTATIKDDPGRPRIGSVNNLERKNR